MQFELSTLTFHFELIMPELDTDLRSIQEARNLAVAARQAQREFFHFTQEQVDKICAAMAEAAYNESARLAQMATDETTYGVPAHKVVKNQFASKFLWDSLKDVKTVGVISRDDTKKDCRNRLACRRAGRFYAFDESDFDRDV